MVPILALAVAVLSLLFGPGLVVRVWNRLIRPRLRVSLLGEDFHGRIGNLRIVDAEPRVMLGVENVGGETTSLRPALTLTGFDPKRRRRAFTFLISSPRDLPPHVERHITATLQKEDVYGAALPGWVRDAEVLGFLWFKTYTLTPTRGRAVRVRIRSADRVRLGWFRFALELLRFRLLGQVHDTPQGTPPTQ